MPKEEEKKEERQEFLKREEIRTMEKDISGLREKEAKKERERIAKIKTEEEIKKEREKIERLKREREERERIPAAILEEKKAIPKEKPSLPKERPLEVKASSVPPLKKRVFPRPASRFEKILIRSVFLVSIILSLVFIATFLYWYSAIRVKKDPLPPLSQEQTVTQPKEKIILSPEEILANFSLKEKVGQLFIIGFEGEEITPEIESIFKNIPPAGVILFSKNIKNGTQVKTLIENLQSLSQETTGLPLFVAVDQEGGIVSRVQFLKEKTAQKDIENEEEAFLVGLKRGKELKDFGFNLNLAPVLDQLNPSDFLYQRSFQKDTETEGLLGKAIIEGQKEAGILSSLKHFPGYTGIAFNPEEKLGKLSKIPEISQFKKAIESDPEFVMLANIIVTELDPLRRFFFSKQSIQFLKESLLGDYLIITDDLNQSVFLDKFSLEDIVTTPIKSGVDVLLFTDFQENPEKALESFFEAAAEGKVSEETIDNAVLKVIQLKERIRR
tara:strand:- start:1887 stop:3383 length:1497 start_codon:yes stop_codon:yes gene_type:complete